MRTTYFLRALLRADALFLPHPQRSSHGHPRWLGRFGPRSPLATDAWSPSVNMFVSARGLQVAEARFEFELRNCQQYAFGVSVLHHTIVRPSFGQRGGTGAHVVQKSLCEGNRHVGDREEVRLQSMGRPGRNRGSLGRGQRDLAVSLVLFAVLRRA